MDFMTKIANHVFKGPLSIDTKRTQAGSFCCKMNSGMDRGWYQMNAVEIPVTIDLLKVLDPFQKQSVSMFKLRCMNCLLVDDATTGNYLTEMDPEFMGEDKTKDSRTEYPEVVDPFNCLVSSIDLLFRISWSATK